eukprot:jgi/Mesvir1/17449/Mv08725-RA.1
MSLLGAPARMTGSRHVAVMWHSRLLQGLRAQARFALPHVATCPLGGLGRGSFLQGTPLLALKYVHACSRPMRCGLPEGGCPCDDGCVSQLKGMSTNGQHTGMNPGGQMNSSGTGQQLTSLVTGNQHALTGYSGCIQDTCLGSRGQHARLGLHSHPRRASSTVASAQGAVREGRPTRGPGDGAAIETPEQLLALKDKKKMRVALLVGYLGTEFKGLQKQEDSDELDTIEAYLEAALFKVGGIRPSNYGQLSKVGWSRSSRTDKGVHSLVTIVSLKMMVDKHAFDGDAEGREIAARINEHLPPSVHVFACIKVARSFNARKAVQSRTYEYMVPAESILGHRLSYIAVSPSGTNGHTHGPLTTLDVPGGQPLLQPSLPRGPAVSPRERLDAMTPGQVALELEQFRAVLRQFEGVHAFHNFTKRRLYRDTFFDRRRSRASDFDKGREGERSSSSRNASGELPRGDGGKNGGGPSASEAAGASAAAGGLQKLFADLRAFLFGREQPVETSSSNALSASPATLTSATLSSSSSTGPSSTSQNPSPLSTPAAAAAASTSAATASILGQARPRQRNGSGASTPYSDQEGRAPERGWSGSPLVASDLPSNRQSPPVTSVNALEASSGEEACHDGASDAGVGPQVEMAGRRRRRADASSPSSEGEEDDDSAASAAADSNESDEEREDDEDDEVGSEAGGELAPQYGDNGELLLSRRKPVLSWSDVIDPEDAISKRHFRRIFEFTCSDVEMIAGRPIVRIIVSGNSFLLNQIRCMVGISMAVAQGFVPPEIIPLMLAKQVRANVPKAPPQNLFLASSVFNFARRQTHAGAAPDPDEDADSPFRSQRMLEIGPVAQQAILEYRDNTMLPGIIALVDAPGSVWSQWTSGWMERQAAYPPEDLASALEQYRAWLARKALLNQEVVEEEEFVE